LGDLPEQDDTKIPVGQTVREKKGKRKQKKEESKKAVNTGI